MGEKDAVAVHDVKGVGGGIGAQGFGDVRHRVGGVVAHPVVEEVAENHQLGMLGRLVFEKALSLTVEANKAIEQIKEKRYIQGLEGYACSQIFGFGIAFCQKACVVIAKELL